MDMIENMNRVGHLFSEAEKYAWAMGEKLRESLGPVMTDPISKGVKFRFMGCESRLPHFNHVPGEAPHIEIRTLTDVPISIVCTEKEAAICLPSTNGRMDYAAFYGTDQTVRKLDKGPFPLLLGQRKTLQPNIKPNFST